MSAHRSIDGSIYISAVLSSGWAKASACCFYVCLSCAAVLCQVVSFEYSSKSFLHRFAGLPRSLFLPYGLQVVMRFVNLSYLNRLMCLAQDHFILLVVFITSVTPVFALTQVMVCYIKHTPLHFLDGSGGCEITRLVVVGGLCSPPLVLDVIIFLCTSACRRWCFVCVWQFWWF